MYLRCTADRIGVLHGTGAFDEPASHEQRAHSFRALDLTLVAALLMNFLIERARAATHGLERQRRRRVGGIGEPLGVVDRKREHARREIGAVDERQSFFERWLDFFRVETEELRQLRCRTQGRLSSRPGPTECRSYVKTPHAEQHDKEVRKRTEVTARAH